MIDITEITPGKSYACKFRLKNIPLDEWGRPGGMMSLADVPIASIGEYESIGVLMQRDMDQRLVKLKDEASRKEFVCSFDDIWDVDEVEWTE